jgi:hypothetical protein
MRAADMMSSRADSSAPRIQVWVSEACSSPK